MAEIAPDVVIVGGGIAGMTTAYYLAKARVTSIVVERDAIGSHPSGFAYGGLSPLSAFGISGPLAEIAQDGTRLHRELCESVVEEAGMDVDFRVRPSLALAFTEADVRRLQAALPWQQRQPGYAARWLDVAEALRVEPRISEETLGTRRSRTRPLACVRWPPTGCSCSAAYPGLEHVYVATGGGRRGILYGPAMGRAIADLVRGRHTRVALEPFAPERFVRA